MIQAKQDVLSLAFPHGLLMLLCDCHMNLVATTHTFWEWMTTVMNWLLCRISLPTPPPCLDPCRLNFFQVNENPTVDLQTEDMIYLEHRYCTGK